MSGVHIHLPVKPMLSATVSLKTPSVALVGEQAERAQVEQNLLWLAEQDTQMQGPQGTVRL